MSNNITLEAVAKVVEEVIKTELQPVKDDLADVKTIQRSHTDSLEKLLTKKKTKEDEVVIAASRLDRLEAFCKSAAKQLNIKFDL